MYDFWKTPEQRRRENRNALIAIVVVFGGLLLLGILGAAFGDSSGHTSSKGRCSTITEPYSNVEHDVYCEGEDDWIYNQLVDSGYDDYDHYEYN